jgi:exosortase
LISWLFAFEVVALSLCAIYFVGGKSWLRHFAFSISFILVSVPWPGAVEDFVIHALTQAATVVTVTCLNLFHFPAVQHRNVIELKTGLVGVDEACSGVRSLQATLMVSLFLGELYRAARSRRIVIVFYGTLIAFMCNVGRTFILTAVAAKYGVEAISLWHDPLGVTFLTICLLLVWGYVCLISGPLSKLVPSKAPPLIPFSWRLASSLGAWVLFTLVITEVWYRSHETRDKSHWSVTWPVYKKDFSDVTIPKLEADALACDQGLAAQWEDDDGSRWKTFFFTWAEGPTRSRILARMHRPENCLPAAGYKLHEDRGTIAIKAKDLVIPFHDLDFEYEGDHVYVFFCLWEDRAKQLERPRIRDDWNQLAKLESVLLGERNLGQQVLEIVVFGYDKPEEAEAALRRDVEAMIQT